MIRKSDLQQHHGEHREPDRALNPPGGSGHALHAKVSWTTTIRQGTPCRVCLVRTLANSLAGCGSMSPRAKIHTKPKNQNIRRPGQHCQAPGQTATAANDGDFPLSPLLSIVSIPPWGFRPETGAPLRVSIIAAVVVPAGCGKGSALVQSQRACFALATMRSRRGRGRGLARLRLAPPSGQRRPCPETGAPRRPPAPSGHVTKLVLAIQDC